MLRAPAHCSEHRLRVMSGRPSSPCWIRADRIRDSALDKNEKAVLNAYLDTDRLANGIELFQSIERIAWMTGIANSTVRLAVARLVNRGVLEFTRYIPARAIGGEPRGRVGVYRFHEEALPA